MQLSAILSAAPLCFVHLPTYSTSALCKGGRVPLCLRRADAAVYTLLGEAYVHEIMDGRAFDEELCEAIALR